MSATGAENVSKRPQNAKANGRHHLICVVVTALEAVELPRVALPGATEIWKVGGWEL
jgi:hypothetical protein